MMSNAIVDIMFDDNGRGVAATTVTFVSEGGLVVWWAPGSEPFSVRVFQGEDGEVELTGGGQLSAPVLEALARIEEGQPSSDSARFNVQAAGWRAPSGHTEYVYQVRRSGSQAGDFATGIIRVMGKVFGTAGSGGVVTPPR